MNTAELLGPVEKGYEGFLHNMTHKEPFEKVVLINGIDNQVLTSYRTLKGANNSLSETHKIVHRKFQPTSNSGRYHKSHLPQYTMKLPYTIQEDDEDSHEHRSIELPIGLDVEPRKVTQEQQVSLTE